MKRGFHVICYIDREEGASAEKGWVDIQLHGRPLGVRMGMAILSHWSGIPICPVVLTIDGEKLTLRDLGDLYVHNSQQYQLTMQYCYNLLEELSVEEILQWECIPKLYDRIAPRLPATADKTPIWLPVYLTGKTMLLDIVSGKCAEVPSTQFERMDGLRRQLLNQVK